MSFAGFGWNSLVFLLFMVAIVAVFIAMTLVFRGALGWYREARYREASSREPQAKE